MFTLGGNTKPNNLPKEESYSINHKATAAAALSRGAIVKLNNAGKVEVVSASTDTAYGQVVVGCKNADELVTVQTQFSAIQNAVADGALTAGDKVSATGWDSTAGTMKYKKSVAGDTVAGIALNTVATGAALQVGVLRTFLKA